MTNRESVVISAYTGFMIGNDFGKVHEYIEEILERPVFTHELASKETHKEIKEKSKKEFADKDVIKQNTPGFDDYFN